MLLAEEAPPASAAVLRRARRQPPANRAELRLRFKITEMASGTLR